MHQAFTWTNVVQDLSHCMVWWDHNELKRWNHYEVNKLWTNQEDLTSQIYITTLAPGIQQPNGPVYKFDNFIDIITCWDRPVAPGI